MACDTSSHLVILASLPVRRVALLMKGGLFCICGTPVTRTDCRSRTVVLGPTEAVRLVKGCPAFAATSLTPQTGLRVIVIAWVVGQAVRAEQLAVAQILEIEVTAINTGREQVHLSAVVGAPAAADDLGGIHHLRFKSSVLLVLEMAGHLLGLPHHLQTCLLGFFSSSLG